MRSLQLPQLHRLLARMGVVADDAGSADSLSMPHERVLARAWGLGAADGRIPLAAWQLQQAGHDPGGAACAWVTPCHLRVGSDGESEKGEEEGEVPESFHLSFSVWSLCTTSRWRDSLQVSRLKRTVYGWLG